LIRKKEMKQEIEIRRKILHLVLGVIISGLVFYEILNAYILGALTVLAAIVLFLYKKKLVPGLDFLLDLFERSEYRKKFPGKGLLFYLLGSTIVVALFPKDISVASILILAIGDSIPNMVGMYYGRIKRPFSNTKFLEGAIAGMILSFLAVINFVIWYEALAASIVALFLEGIDMKIGLDKIDDNLTVPIFAAVTIFVIRIFF